MSSNAPKLEHFPVELIQYIGFFVNNNKALSNFSKTNKTINQGLNGPQGPLKQRAAAKLLSHVVKGEQSQALAMIETRPRLLLITSEARDYSDGRTIQQTAFEAALCAGDNIMAKAILAHLDAGEAARQFSNAFPKGIEQHTEELKTKAYDFSEIIDAILKGDNDILCDKVNQFHQAMAGEKTISQGAHFNMYHLSNAYQAYAQNFDNFTTWENRDYFWQKIIGFIQRQIPTHYAQEYCRQADSNTQARSLSDFYSSKLGVEHAIEQKPFGESESTERQLYAATTFMMCVNLKNALNKKPLAIDENEKKLLQTTCTTQS